MLFVNVNLNLRQARVSLRLPERLETMNKINLEVKRDGELIVNLIYKLIVGSNLTKFKLVPPSLRQFNYSKDTHYNLSFLIECDFEYTLIDERCTLKMPSDNEMAVDWAYCCGDNQRIHLQSLDLDKFNRTTTAGKSNLSNETDEISKRNRSEPLNESNETGEISKQLNEPSDLNDFNQLYILFSKQKLFTKFLIESTNQTDYIVLQLLSNRCLIAFDDDGCSSNSDILDTKSVTTSKEFELREAIFVEFKYLDFACEPDDVKMYRHSFEHEYMRLDCELFGRLFERLYKVNKSILPLTARYKSATKFNYSYLVYGE